MDKSKQCISDSEIDPLILAFIYYSVWIQYYKKVTGGFVIADIRVIDSFRWI